MIHRKIAQQIKNETYEIDPVWKIPYAGFIQHVSLPLLFEDFMMPQRRWLCVGFG